MSHQDPGTDAQPQHQDLAVPAVRKPGGARRYVAAFAAAGLGAATVGGAIWAWQAFMAQGPQPAEALPASTLAYAALDLDPPGGQKVAAYKALRKFPSIKSELGLGSVDDLHKSVVNEISSESGCDLDYAAVKPWLGDRVAFAVVQQKTPEPVLVLQVADEDGARTGLRRASTDCDFGFALRGGWAILARNQAVATQVDKDATRGTLDDRKDFKRLTEAAGDSGLVTLYAAPEAGPALLDVIDNDPYSGLIAFQMVNGGLDPVTSFVTSFGLLAAAEPDHGYSESSSSSYEPDVPPRLKKKQRRLEAKFEHYEELSPAEQKALEAEQQELFEEMYGSMDDALPEGSVSEGAVSGEGDDLDGFPIPEIDPALRESLQKFSGLGGIGRIADDGLEVEIVGDELKGTSASMYAGSEGRGLVSDLPGDSAVAFGAGFADGWVDVLFGQLSTQFLYFGSTRAETVAAFEKATGLDVPGDLEALGGDGVSVVAGPGLSLDGIYDDPAHTPVAARITGDADRIEAALGKLRTGLGTDGSKLLSRRVGDDVVVSANASYLADLEKPGDLGGSDQFRRVLPDADGAASVFYLNFDAGNWLVKQSSASDRADVEPLNSLGMSVTKEDGQQHIVVRLSFDD